MDSCPSTWSESDARRWRKINPFDQFLTGIPYALYFIAALAALLVT